MDGTPDDRGERRACGGGGRPRSSVSASAAVAARSASAGDVGVAPAGAAPAVDDTRAGDVVPVPGTGVTAPVPGADSQVSW